MKAGGLGGKRAIITGASKSIGLAVARRLAMDGAAVAICSRSDEEIAAAATELKALGGQVYSAACDVADKAALDTFIANAASAHGGIDILVNSAAYIPFPVPFEDYDDAMFEQAFDVGVVGAFRAMKAAFPHLKKQGGRIVNFTSIGGLRGGHGQAGYAAAKTGIIGVTRVAAAEWAPHGITANCIAPMAMSDTWSAYLATLEPGVNPFHAVGVHSNAFDRPGDVDADIAPAVAFLCSDDARFITGTILPVDGGLLDLE